MTPADAVVDASAAVRGLTTEGEAAELLARIADGASTGHAPELIVAEVSNASRSPCMPTGVRWTTR
ncbi:MAG: hypothetical protein ACRDNY_06590 [Gaiellaceae bacterium]